MRREHSCALRLVQRSRRGQLPAGVTMPALRESSLAAREHPEKPLPDVDDWHSPAWLSPADVVEQFIVSGDDQARELGDLVTRHIVIDGMSPDQDHRSYWQAAIANTAEHLRLGGHPDREAS